MTANVRRDPARRSRRPGPAPGASGSEIAVAPRTFQNDAGSVTVARSDPRESVISAVRWLRRALRLSYGLSGLGADPPAPYSRETFDLPPVAGPVIVVRRASLALGVGDSLVAGGEVGWLAAAAPLGG